MMRYMNRCLFSAACALVVLPILLLNSAVWAAEVTDRSASSWVPLPKELGTNLFLWRDTCNVYVLRKGEDALVIDLGDGSVLEHLSEIGVQKVEWVLFTHHHREQCQGAPRLKGRLVRIAAPEAERSLFEQPASFRKMKPSLGDRYTVHGASYVRPPIEAIKIDRGIAGMDSFTWRGHEFRCLETKGNSPGGMSYFLEEENGWLAFTGDVMLEGARMHNWFDSEWDYGFAAGIYPLHAAASLIESFDPPFLFPSHGPIVPNPVRQLRQYQEKLRRLERLLVRGYEINTFQGADQDRLSRPTAAPNVWQVSKHLFKFKGPGFYPNFTLILSDSGHALVSDCGLMDKKFLNDGLEGLREHYGLKTIDALIVSHMHGDHFLQAPFLSEKWGAQVWALDRMAAPMEHPERFDYCAMIESYGDGFDSIHLDRTFKPGESFDWEGHRFTVDWMPGQTEFALCLHGRIDGRKVAFTGDNLFGNPRDPKQTGHEAVVGRNSAILEEGYIYGAEFLKRLKPDLLMGGHSFVMDKPAKFIERFRAWSYDMREAFRALSSDSDYRYGFDPYWVRAEPYRINLHAGTTAEFTVHFRNFLPRRQQYRVEFHAPAGLAVEPAEVSIGLEPEARSAVPVRVRAAGDGPTGLRIIGLDITRDGQRCGELFDCIVNVEGK